jgi:hypothetical protein
MTGDTQGADNQIRKIVQRVQRTNLGLVWVGVNVTGRPSIDKTRLKLEKPGLIQQKVRS